MAAVRGVLPVRGRPAAQGRRGGSKHRPRGRAAYAGSVTSRSPKGNGIVGFIPQKNHLLGAVEEGQTQRSVNLQQEHFTETHPGEERLTQTVEDAEMFEAK